MNIRELRAEINDFKDKEQSFNFLEQEIYPEVKDIMGILGTNKKKTYYLGNDEVGYIEYNEDIENNVILKFIKTINSNFEVKDKINGLGNYILRDFIVTSSYNQYIIDTITMSNRKFFFKLIRYLLTNNIISEVEFVRDNTRANYNRMDDDMKKIITNNHAFKKIIIKK